MVSDQVRTVMHGPPPLDLTAVVRVLEYLGLADDDSEERLEVLIKVKTIHQAVIRK